MMIYMNKTTIDPWGSKEIKIEVKGYKCERCGHEWIPRKKEYPVLCPNCESAYWDKPARKKK